MTQQIIPAQAPVTQDSNLIIPIDGGGLPITTGIKVRYPIDFPGTIVGWTLLADQAGSIVIDIWKDTYANYPPTVADSITASAKPTLSGADKNRDTTLAGWTTNFAAGDDFVVTVTSVSTVTQVTLALKVRR